MTFFEWLDAHAEKGAHPDDSSELDRAITFCAAMFVLDGAALQQARTRDEMVDHLRRNWCNPDDMIQRIEDLWPLYEHESRARGSGLAVCRVCGADIPGDRETCEGGCEP